MTRELDLHLSVNPASPLFARLAEALIRNGEVSRAEQICEKGLELYPSYPTGRLIYAHCLAARSRYESALALLNEVLSRYPGNIALWQLQEEWMVLAGLHPERATDVAALFTDLPVDAGAVEEIPLPAAERAPIQAAPDPDEMPGGVEASPPMTVPSMQDEHIPPLRPVPSPWKPAGFIEADRIVSRTLAEIYASQGAIGEAVETYRILLDRMPERREMLEGRLRELEDRLKIGPGEHRAIVE